VVISKKAGSGFSACKGELSATMPTFVEPTLIVQSWRSSAFKRNDDDSTLILLFRQDGDRGRIELTHVHLPGHGGYSRAARMPRARLDTLFVRREFANLRD